MLGLKLNHVSKRGPRSQNASLQSDNLVQSRVSNKRREAEITSKLPAFEHRLNARWHGISSAFAAEMQILGHTIHMTC